MESRHYLSSSQIHGLMRGEAVGPFILYASGTAPDGHTLPLRIAHATLTLYCRYGRPLVLRFSQNNPVDRHCVRVAFDETEDGRWRLLTLTLVDSPSGEAGEASKGEPMERRVLWTPKGAWDAAKNRALTGGPLAVAFDPPWRSLPPQPSDEAAAPEAGDEEGGKEEEREEKIEPVGQEGVYHESIRVRGGRTECFLGYRAWQEQGLLPSSIEIHVALVPVWIDNQTASAQLGDASPCLLYPHHSAFSEVLVEPKGAGNYQLASGGERIPFVGTDLLGYRLVLPEPLYRKRFRTQPEGQRIQSNGYSHEGIPPLWAYGAGQVGDDIYPMAFEMDSVREETVVRAFSLLYWRKQGIYSGGLAFQDTFEEDESCSLCESLEAGKSMIHLEAQDGRGKLVKIPYQSYRLENNFIFYRRQEQP